jgi:preprotein translocase subunit SecA
LQESCLRLLALDVPIKDWAQEEGIADQEILERLTERSNRKMAEKAANYGPELMRMAEKSLLLQILDQQWKEHLLSLDHLKQGINLRAYAQKDPLNEYKREAFMLFDGLLTNLRETVTSVLSHLEIQLEGTADDTQDMQADDLGGGDGAADMRAGDAVAGAASRSNHGAAVIDPADPSTWGKVPRNAPCPCGSGKKYKHCHGKMA